MEQLGTEYGGWFVEVDLVPSASVVISAGVGEDMSFDEALYERVQPYILLIDPTEKAEKYWETQTDKFPTVFVKAALTAEHDQKIRMWKNNIPNHVSESVLEDHQSTGGVFYEADTTSIPHFLSLYDNISLIKMDVEGAEYDIIMNLPKITVPQLCIEFHHFCTNKTFEDTKECLRKLQDMGYVVAHNRKNFREVTLIHEDA